MEIIVEILLQMIFELLAEFGTRIFSHSFNFEKTKSPFLASIGYVILATLLSGSSLYIVPNHFIENPELRIANLIITPILLGVIMSLRGRVLIKKQRQVMRIDSFTYGYLFALTFGAIRFFFAQ